MPSLPLTFVVVALLATLTACGGDAPESNASPTATPSSAGTTAVPPSASPTSAAPTTVSTSTSSPGSTPTADCTTTGKVVPDGTWQGPIAMTVRVNNGKSGYADSPGTGRLRLTVKDGKVTEGAWTLSWKSHGVAETAQAAATVDLTGTVTGTAQGSAAKPVLPDAWKIEGIARVTRPSQTTMPFDETGRDSETMTITSSTCERVTGTFVPSFSSKEAAATFAGTATWIGTRR